MRKPAGALALSLLVVLASRPLTGQNATEAQERTLVAVQPLRVLTSDRDYEPAVSPDGRRVVFARSPPAGRTQLWTVSVQGGNGQQLTPEEFPYNAGKPSWSPDGRLIAFRASRQIGEKEKGGIWLISASGGALRPVLGDAVVDDYYPQWFSDGRRLVVFRNVLDKQSDVWLIDVDSRTARQLTSHPAFDGKSTISPDSTRIAFPSERSGQRDIWIMPLAEGEAGARQFTINGGRGPAWSPDGRWIAYGCPIAPQVYALCLKAVAGGPVIQVTDGKTNDFNPEWAPDSKSIVVSRTSGIAVIDVTGIVK